MNTLRVAVVGAGRLGGFHAQKLSAMESVDLVAVVDPLESQRDRVAEQCKTRALADYRDLFGTVDAVVIAAPTSLHHSLGREFLSRGINVLMEKPLAPTAAHALELAELAQQRGVVLQVGHVEQFNPAFVASLDQMRDPKYIEATRTSPFTFRSTDVGAVLDLMIHDLELVLSLVRSPIQRIDAVGVSVLGGHEDAANARLEFANGCVAVLNASRVSYESLRRMHVWCPSGFTAIDFAARSATSVRPGEALTDGTFDVDSLAPEQVEHYRQYLFDELLPRQQTSYDAVDALALEDADFVSSVLQSRPPRVGGQQAAQAVAIAEAILRRIESHRWSEPAPVAGPQLAAPPHIIPAPHFQFGASHRRREAS